MGAYSSLMAGVLKKNAARRPSAESLLYDEIAGERGRGEGYDAARAESRGRYEDILGGGEAELDRYIKSAVSAGMPELNRNLQGAREGAISRGVGLGELGTSYEGDIYSAFNRNIANAAGAQAMNLYGTRTAGYGNLYESDTAVAEGGRNRYLDILAGQRDADIAKANAKKKRGSFLGALAGGVGGFLIGGPAGAGAGAQIGSRL
jgi:hypothetical protein